MPTLQVAAANLEHTGTGSIPLTVTHSMQSYQDVGFLQGMQELWNFRGSLFIMVRSSIAELMLGVVHSTYTPDEC